MEKNKIAVIGVGYVGLSLSVLLSRDNEVVALDVDEAKVDSVNNNISPIADSCIQKNLVNKNLSLSGTLNKKEAYSDANFVIIATPTNYDEKQGYFDTSSVELAIEDSLDICPEALIVIKSTIPIGFTKRMSEKFNSKNIIYSPEFLREGFALYDNFYPSRIIIGGHCNLSRKFSDLLVRAAKKEPKDIPLLFMDSTEAECVKLFSNSYLALRVAFFNELDGFAESNELNSKNIIQGMSSDTRIGNFYNNPSFGYGGYCLPKDTKQLLASFSNKIPKNIINAVVESNEDRKTFIANNILKKNPKIVGIYSLVMKSGSNNYRASAIIDVMHNLKKEGISVIIYEPAFDGSLFEGIKVEKNFDEFKKLSDIIITNRMTTNLSDCQEKIYTRDIFGDN